MTEFFGTLPTGETATLYTLTDGTITVAVTDYGATLVRVLTPDRDGRLADVVLGYDDANGYATGGAFLGAIVGRNANRIQGASFMLDGRTVRLTANENTHNLHSGPDCFHTRLWQVAEATKTSITFRLDSPNGDQGFPGNAHIRVTYTLEHPSKLKISYYASCDQDTVFNMTNHSYFNLAGQDHPELAMSQTLMMPARHFLPDDAESIPTGELCPVDGTPMDFRTPKAIGRDIGGDYEPLRLQGGYDHNFEVFCAPCAVLSDPGSGRSMAVITDLPGVQLYSGNYLHEYGKGGLYYGPRSGVCLETQFYPDALHHPSWAQPVTRVGETYRANTSFRFFTA